LDTSVDFMGSRATPSSAGVEAEDVIVMVVAEFLEHRGRKMLRERGFGKVRVVSLMVFGGK
jgi:hypothetical protein